MSTKRLIPAVLIALAVTLAAADLNEEIGKGVAKLLSTQREYRNVTFTVEDEIVTVSGKVSTWTDRTNLEWSLRRINHVRNVRNEVVLDPPVVSDEVLRARGRKALLAAGFDEVRFQAHEGLVLLTGSARTRVQWARIQDVAWSVEGVREVITRIRVLEE
ncbi:MAG: BON domain-containing protein [Terriglobales bacterium]